MTEALRVQKLLIEQNAEIDRLKNRIEQLEAALRGIEYLDRPQVRGLPRQISIHEIARTVLGGKKDD
jgi:predicted  nucleic acid-binding Zn-ribbon protein